MHKTAPNKITLRPFTWSIKNALSKKKDACPFFERSFIIRVDDDLRKWYRCARNIIADRLTWGCQAYDLRLFHAQSIIIHKQSVESPL
jgi:hypothetical protein